MVRQCWKLPESAFVDLTPARARDLVVDCFFFAQHETFARAKEKVMARHMDDASLHASIVSAVRLAFRECDGDYDQPTLASLAKVVAVLERKAEAWGTPTDIVQHHRGEVEIMLRRMGHRG
jgi:hypothetical protein